MTTYAFPGAIGDVASNGKIESTWGNAVRDRLIAVFGSAAARASALPAPQVGQSTVQTDTMSFLQYVGATDGWQKVWNMPWGLMPNGLASLSTTQSAVGAITDVTGLTLTNTFVANRFTRVTVIYRVTKNTTGLWSVGVNDGTNTLVVGSNNTADTIAISGTGTYVVGSTAAAITYKVRLTGNATAGTADATASATQPWRILVEDIGPNGNPV